MKVDLVEAVALLKSGEVVAIPTETVYGLAANARNENAIKKIYATKQRPESNPLIVHIASSEQVLDWAIAFPPLAKKLANAFWPGPLTLVLPAKPEVLNIVRASEPTIALRVPAHPIALQLLSKSGLGLAAPSANQYTQLSPTTAQHVIDGLGEHVPILDGGASNVGIESTIVAVEDNEWRLLRLGMITEDQIEAVAGKSVCCCSKRALPKVPGQHLLHYSPKTPIYLFESRVSLFETAAQHSNCALLLVGDNVIANKHTFYLPNDPSVMAEKLYDQLHQMDALKMSALLIEMPPNQAEWLAIRDRLTRAAHKLN